MRAEDRTEERCGHNGLDDAIRMRPGRAARARLALACAVWAGALLACASPPPLATVAATEHHALASRHVDQAFSIDVYRPPGIEGPLPVVIVLDGNGYFAMAAQTAAPMIYARELPPMLVVGVGYEVENVMEVVSLRVRDLTPTHDPGFRERMARQGMPLPPGIEPGGADAFLAFLDQELRPFLAARYEIDPTDRTLVGDSFGGLFAMHVAIHSPESFDRYVIGSPALDWDGGKLFADEAARAARTDEWPVKMFLSAGELEIENGILAATRRMAAVLEERRYRGLEWSVHVFEDETHHSVIGPTMSRGLRAVFGAHVSR